MADVSASELGVSVIHLQGFDIDCCICDREWSYSPAGPSFGLPIYESEIVPDDHKGPWGGVPVCPRCYFIVRGLQSEFPGRLIATHQVRRLISAPDRTPPPAPRTGTRTNPAAPGAPRNHHAGP